MKRIKMIVSQKGSNDGYTTKEFIEGQCYNCPSEISEYLVSGWSKRGICAIVDITEPEEKKIVEPDEKKKTRKPRKPRTPRKKVEK